MDHWIEVGDGVLVRRHDELDLSTGLVLGETHALVVDTGGDERHGARLLAAVRDVTELPLRVAITHGHFDHCFGTAAFLPAPVWAHPDCSAHLRRTASRQRSDWAEHYRRRGLTEVAGALAATEPVLPDHAVSGSTDLDLGGRTVRLLDPGRGHTDHDLVVEVVDAGVLFAGDLVEHGAPPSFEDAFPREWPAALDVLTRTRTNTVVPGHGDPVDGGFLARQRAEIAEVAALCRAVGSGELSIGRAVAESPYPTEVTRTALERGG